MSFSLTTEQVAFVERLRGARETGTHYEVLRVDQSAPTTEIRERYDDLARGWHPDKFHRLDDLEMRALIEENFAGINEAFATLKDERKRAAYDRELKRRGVTPPREVPASAVEPRQAATHEMVVDRRAGRVVIEPVTPPKSTASAPVRAARGEAPRQIKVLKEQIALQLARARSYHDAARADALTGAWAKAESNFYLATRYDPRNAEYQAAYEEARTRAQATRAATFVTQGDQAATYGRYKEAIAAYQKASEMDPQNGIVWFKLGQMLLSSEDDHRGAVDAWRKAVAREPRNVAYRLSLGELYDKLGLKQNAMREAKSILDIDAKHEGALAMQKRLR